MSVVRAGLHAPTFAQMRPVESRFSAWAPAVDRIAALLSKAVEWTLTACCAAMALVAMGHLVLPAGSFRTDSLPGAIFYFAVLITMFAAFYCALALVASALYHRYRRLPVWLVVRPGAQLLAL